MTFQIKFKHPTLGHFESPKMLITEVEFAEWEDLVVKGLNYLQIKKEGTTTFIHKNVLEQGVIFLVKDPS